MFYRKLLFLIVFSAGHLIYSQDTVNKSVFRPEIDEIISLKADYDTDLKVAIANLTETKINEAPGTVHIITSEEIERKGYRDLIDVFSNIPGFTIATDVQNGTGLILRGAWASEARILIMIDGLVMNDMSYGSFVLGGRFPLSHIERIEVVKGASSTIYGGIAGLGVVNIITREGKSARGSKFIIDAGYSGRSLSTRRLTFNNTSYLLNDFELSVCSSILTGNKSNQIFMQADNSETSYRDSSSVSDVFFQMKIKRKGFEYKLNYNNYEFQATHEGISSLYRSVINDLNYSKKINKLDISLNFQTNDQIPWNTQYGDPAIFDETNIKTRRYTAGALLNYETSHNSYFLLGLTYKNDFMNFYHQGFLFNNGKINQDFNSFAGFSDFSLKTKLANVYLGGRFDYYETFNPDFSPRISITKEFKVIHYKLTYGQSFKIPTLQNINLAYLNSRQLIPEKINDFQIEFGLNSKNHNLKTALFHTEINNVIVFGYDYENKIESYVNEGDMSLAGFEVQLQNKFGRLEFNAGYSHYILIKSTAPTFLVDVDNLKNGTLSSPKHKIMLSSFFEISKKAGFHLNYIFQSEKFGYEQIDKLSGEVGMVRFKPAHLVDVSFRTKGFSRFFDINLGLKNVLNIDNYLVYPASSGYPSAIDFGREIFIKLNINL